MSRRWGVAQEFVTAAGEGVRAYAPGGKRETGKEGKVGEGS